MKTLFAMFAVISLAGCAGLQGSNGMTPDQLKAVAGDKNTGVLCSDVVGAGFTAHNIFISYDKSTVIDGGVTAKCGDYQVGITTTTPVKPAAPAVKP